MESIPIVRVVADEFGDHLPVWFPPPIYDYPAQMPASPHLLEQFREWNRVGSEMTAEAGSMGLMEHYRVGLELAQKLANELGPSYAVDMLIAGDPSIAGWRRIPAIP